MRRIYMDANATTPLAPEVFEAMRPWMLERFGNASSVHYFGQKARGAVEEARISVAALLNCRPAEVVFTSGGTEGDNLALFGLVRPGDHLITSTIEHHAVLHAAECLQKRGVEVTFLPVCGESVVDPADVKRALRPNTRLISIMMANNETGAVQPVEEIGRIAAEAHVYFHTDAVQASGKLPIDVETIGCDLLTIAAHKMYGPQGTGALYVRSGVQLEPLFYGGAHERQRRAGTENVAGIVGLGNAAQHALADLHTPFKPSVDLSEKDHPASAPFKPSVGLSGTDTSGIARIAHLRERFENGLLLRLEDVGVNGGRVPRVPNTTNLWFDHLEGEALVIALDLNGLACSGGSACASGAAEPSHVLSAMGLSRQRGRASLRFSLTRYSTAEEIDLALDLISTAVERLRALAPVSVPR